MCVDAVYAVVQPPGQTAAAEVVWSTSRQSEKEDYTRIDNNDSVEEAKDVLLSWVERLEDHLQKVNSRCSFFFLDMPYSVTSDFLTTFAMVGE